MRRHIAYLKYVLRHKWFVLLAGLKLGIPLLILIFHDWDKFLPDEWFPYARTFYKPDGSNQYEEGYAFAEAWMFHQHRNKHHWQYWLNFGKSPLSDTNVMVWDRGNASILVDGNIYALDGDITIREPMPEVYAREMLADWHGAGRAITGEWGGTRDWYLKNKENIKLHPDTRRWIEDQLGL